MIQRPELGPPPPDMLVDGFTYEEAVAAEIALGCPVDLAYQVVAFTYGRGGDVLIFIEDVPPPADTPEP